VPPDPGVRFVPVPHGWPPATAFLVAPLRGVDLPAVVFGDAPSSDATQDVYVRAQGARTLRHVLAHEAYPGHHLEALFTAQACRLRGAVSSQLFVEGWGVHAVDVMHAEDACRADALDRWERAHTRLYSAWGAVVEVAVHCLHATPDEIRGWHPDVRATVDVDSLVETAEELPGLFVSYVLGPRQIADLEQRAEDRAGADFDIAAFRTRLLQAGPLPPRFLEAELLETD